MTSESTMETALARLLAAIGGDHDDLAELMQDFLDGVPSHLEKIRSAATSQDWHATRIAAHTLKSDCRNFGAEQLATLCQTLESQAKNEAVENLQEQITAIEQATLLATEQLKQIDPADVK